MIPVSEIKVGNKMKLKHPCMGNDIGTEGVCYETYELGNHVGVSFLFPNGKYDGFSQRDLSIFMENGITDHVESVEDYEFEHVHKLGEDYRNGYFDEAFKD